MSRSLRFIAIALVGWVGIRAVSLGMVPGAEALAFDRSPDRARSSLASTSDAAMPPVVATEFAPVDPLVPPDPNAAPGMPFSNYAPVPAQYGYPSPAGYAPAYYAAYPRQAPSGFTGSSRPGRRLDLDGVGDWSLEPGAARYAGTTPLDQWPLAQIARAETAPSAASAQSAAVVRPRLDRLSLTAWAMLRSQPTGRVVATDPSLAANGTLGGSQAGARILYRFDRRLALSVRTTAPVGWLRSIAQAVSDRRS